MITFNQLTIYKSFGQFDNIVSITISEESEDFQKYGKKVTGEIFYKDIEKQNLQSQLDNNEQIVELGKIKIRDLTSDFSKEKKYDLLYDGLNIESISEIFSIPFSTTNKYSDNSIRKLPEPMKINIDSRGFDAPKAFINLNERSREDGFKLLEFEELEDVGYRIIDNDYIIPKGLEEFENNEYVRYFVLKYKHLYSELTNEEDIEFKELIKKRTKESVEMLFAEMKKGSNNDLSFLKGRQDILNKMSLLVTYFKPERLCWTKVPIWWNLERYLHIFLRHVSTFQYGEVNEEKTAFQYELNDIKNLVDIILQNLSDEINIHFEKYPERDFKRQGGMSYYYNGDYYAIHIRNDGLLMTLYKNN
jgi:hypothetical protein